MSDSQGIQRDPETAIEDVTGKTEGTGCCVCVTVPHRALTAPRRVASLKSRLAPTCPTRGQPRLAVAAGYSGNWHSDRAFGKFPPIYRSVHKPNPPRVRTGPYVGRKVGSARSKEGRNSPKRGGTANGSRGIFRVRISRQR